MCRPVLACLAALALAGLAVLPPSGEAPAGERGKVLTNSIGMKLTPIPKGKFLMGSPETEKERDEGERQHEVEISKPFYMGVYEVTQGEYVRVMSKPRRKGAPVEAGPDYPKAHVQWDHAVNFCNRLTALPAEKAAGRKYRLPTEAEWEYACRAGTTTPFHFGASLSAKQANFNGNFPYGGANKGPYLRKITKVGSYPPNAWGLYDMHGNVFEWCSDYYDKDYYKKAPKIDPPGPAEGVHPTGYKSRTVPGPGQFYRVIRGGSWLDEARGCRSAYRFRAMPHDPYQMIGLRVVCEVEAKGR